MLPINVMIWYMGLNYHNNVVHQHSTDSKQQRENQPPSNQHNAVCMLKPDTLTSIIDRNMLRRLTSLPYARKGLWHCWHVHTHNEAMTVSHVTSGRGAGLLWLPTQRLPLFYKNPLKQLEVNRAAVWCNASQRAAHASHVFRTWLNHPANYWI